MSNVDQGTAFGTWGDPTSRVMYYESMQEIYQLVKNRIPDEGVADFGGGNGLLKGWFPNIITIDSDPDKKPDILDDIMTHDQHYPFVIMRFLLHYLTDQEVLKLMDKLAGSRTLIIQFVNDDLAVKYYNSVNETKYFRTKEQLLSLLPSRAIQIYRRKYIVDRAFYENRLALPKTRIAIPHSEEIIALEI